MPSFLIPFIFIFLAEFGDKTMLTVILLASKTSRHLMLLAGVMLAFALVDGTAIWIGSSLPHLLPPGAVRILTGALFIFLGIWMLIKKEEDEEASSKKESRNPFALGFTLIFFAEWGDKTQLASGGFAAQYHPGIVFIAMMAALGLISILAIYAGKFLAKRVSPGLLKKISAVFFILAGIIFLIFK